MPALGERRHYPIIQSVEPVRRRCVLQLSQKIVHYIPVQKIPLNPYTQPGKTTLIF